jgi:hypothetical protein
VGRGHWLAADRRNGRVFRGPFGTLAIRRVFRVIGTNGTASRYRWTVVNPPIGSCYSFGHERSRPACGGWKPRRHAGEFVARSAQNAELPPQVVAVLQDTNVLAGRPFKPCTDVPFDPRNYGTVLAVLFSKPMTSNGVTVPTAYALENGNRANSVQIQPGGRVALLNMALPVGALRPRTMTVTGVTDPHGNAVTGNSRPVQSALGRRHHRSRPSRARGWKFRRRRAGDVDSL